MKWVVYTLGTRDISDTLREVPETLIVRDRYRQHFDTFILALKAAGSDSLLLMEDDIELCTDFKQRVLAEINKRPHEFISFFTGMRDVDSSRYVDYANFNLCFYYPPLKAMEFLDFVYLWRNRLSRDTGSDICRMEYIAYYHYPCWQVSPSLVQHKPVESTINIKRSKHRQSRYFAG